MPPLLVLTTKTDPKDPVSLLSDSELKAHASQPAAGITPTRRGGSVGRLAKKRNAPGQCARTVEGSLVSKAFRSIATTGSNIHNLERDLMHDMGILLGWDNGPWCFFL